MLNGKLEKEYLEDRCRQYWILMRFDRPIGIFLLLWPSMWALWISADGFPQPLVFFVIVSGVVIMRAAGCVINDYADREFDPKVERTRNRPIAAGRVTEKEALLLFASLCLLAFALVLLLNWMTVLLSVVGALLAASYPFMKRYTHLPQLYLGVAFGWAVPMVFAAQTGSVPLTAWLLYAATILWTLAYDTMYGMVDRDDDLKIGVKSTAILFGNLDRGIIAIIQVSSILMLYVVAQVEAFTWPFYLGLVASLGLIIYQQCLIANRSKEGCFNAFLNNNYLGGSVFLGIFVQYLLY